MDWLKKVFGNENSNKKVDIDAHLRRDVTAEDIKTGNVPYIKNYNLRLESDYDDEVDSFADETRQDMIIAARERHRQEQQHAREEEQLLLDDEEQPGGEMHLDAEGRSLARPRQEIRPVRAEMDPQSRKTLEADLQHLKGSI